MGGQECLILPRSCGTRLRVDVEFLIGDAIAHAKPRQEYGVDPQRTRSPDAGRGADAERKGIPDVRM